MRLRLPEALGAVIVLAVTIAACVIAIASLCGCSAPESATWPESAEFSTLATGQDRFSTHGTNLDHWYVVVDHSTGVEYLYAGGAGLCPLLDADGTPLLVLEAGE